MKNILLGVLILFTFLTLSNYTAAQVIYGTNFTGTISDPFMEFTLLNSITFNLTSSHSCSIHGSGSCCMEANSYSQIWLEVDGNTSDKDASVRYTANYGTVGVDSGCIPFNTFLTKSLGKGSHTVRIWGFADAIPHFYIYTPNITVICTKLLRFTPLDESE